MWDRLVTMTIPLSANDSAIPLANGGIVTKPTLGLVGEAGPEAIIPLSKLGSFGGGVNITITGNSFSGLNEREVVRQLNNTLMTAFKQNAKMA